MELRHYGSILWRRWPIWVALTLLAGIVSALNALLGPAAYQVSMRLAVGTEPLPTAVGYYDPNYYSWLSSEYLADDLAEFLKSEAFAQELSAAMGSGVSPAAIADVTRTKKTHRMLDVTLSAPTAEQAEALGAAYQRVVNERLPTYFPQVRVQSAQVIVINQPRVGRANSLPLLAAEIGLRTLVGLALGLGLAFLVEYLDNSVRDRAEAERLMGVPVLGEIPTAR